VGDDQPGLSTRAYVTSGWVYQEADLSALAYTPVGAVRLVSFFWEYNSPNTRGEAGMRLTLAEMRLIDADGTETPLNPFENGTWEFMYDRGATVNNSAIRTGIDTGELHNEAVYIRWSQDAQRSTIGMNLNYPEWGPIDAVVSRRVYEENGLSVGEDASPFRLIDIGRMQVQFRAMQVTDYYPSLYDRVPDGDVVGGDKGDAFMIVDVRELMYVINRRPSATYYPSEVWMRFNASIDSHDEDEVAARLQQLDDSESSGVVIVSSVTMANELSKLRTNPLGLGLLGLMYLAFIMALALSVVGLLTYAGLTAQSRRTEFGVLRALGLSSLRVVGALALEQLFVMITGVALGAVLGWVLSSQVVPTLALGATGESVVPPFIMQVETTRLLEYGVMMLVVMLLVLSSSLLLVRQLSLARTLRLGEE
ncbi:MAG TPA: ABC transporter permease, partial [Aggregatilineaceae bacterium]|nr:ABC transporter permease [Aggregatilineaceae bacterium]